MPAGDDDDDSDAKLTQRLRELLRAPDFSAARTNARLELHETLCDERQRSTLASLARMEIALAASHTRMDKISGRMWAAAATGLGMGVAAVAALLLLIITRGLK